jgi:diguanylate cyclase (GGDEF)-like protein
MHAGYGQEKQRDMDMNSALAKQSLKQLIQDGKWLFLSPREVTRRLDDLSKALIVERIQVQIRQHDQTYVWGALDAPPTKVLQRGTLGANVDFSVLGDRHPETAEEQEILPDLTELAKALWGEDMRQAGGLAWKRESVRTRLATSVERLREDSEIRGSIAVLYGDLDNFKQLNDQAGHDKGDEAIRLVNREFHDLCLRHGGLPFHPSGDEYYLILPDVGLLPMMEALYDLRKKILSHSFLDRDGRQHSIDLTLGLQILRDEVTFDRVEQALSQAEEATKSRPGEDDSQLAREAHANANSSKQKRRGKLSIANTDESPGTEMAARDLARLGAVVARRRSCLPRQTFLDPRLGMMELVAQNHGEDSQEDLDQRIISLCDWLDVQSTSKCWASSILEEQPPLGIPHIASAIAIASGIIRRWHISGNDFKNLSILFSRNGSSAQVRIEDTPVWGVLDENLESERIDIVSAAQDNNPAPLIGLQVGLSEKLKFACESALPHDLFSQVVLIDDRPNSGGGLPDFWQVALAQVCQYAAPNVNKATVLAWGRSCNNSETIRRIRQDVEWSIDEIATLAGIDSEVVRTLRPILKENLVLVETVEELVDSLYEIAPLDVFGNQNREDATASSSEVLRRNMLESQSLDQIDGVRCKTAAQAYPVVIDVLRKAATRKSADDALQTLRELIAFKLVLDTPNIQTVPTYFDGQKDDMQRYAEEVLLNRNSRIRKILERDKQVDSFKHELASCYGVSTKHRSTRRAILVVPCSPNSDRSSPPEGLVSAWASPRVEDEPGEGIVDWVFVWRTVEAFVGLPYSLYGSIQLAQTLQSEIATMECMMSTKLRMGQLTYVALSLHMRIDGVHHRIAKRIVDLSSD